MEKRKKKKKKLFINSITKSLLQTKIEVFMIGFHIVSLKSVIIH